MSPLEDSVRWRPSSTGGSSPSSLLAEDQALPRQLPEQSSYASHRTVPPVLADAEETSSAASGSEWDSGSRKGQSSQLLVPPVYEAVFAGHQTLRVSESLQASKDPASAGILPGASVQGERNSLEGLSATEEHLQEEADSPGLSDSDLEFFDCRQGFSDVDLEDACCRISEPPSPMPGSPPHDGVRKWRKSLGQLAHDYEAAAPVCEELRSRHQAGYCHGDGGGGGGGDVLGRVSKAW